jgi:hypothetical protein
MKQGTRSQRRRAEKKARKARAMKEPGARSDYAKKKIEQSNGNFRPGSPFVAIREAREEAS